MENVATDPDPSLHFLPRSGRSLLETISLDGSYWKTPVPSRVNLLRTSTCVDFPKREKKNSFRPNPEQGNSFKWHLLLKTGNHIYALSRSILLNVSQSHPNRRVKSLSLSMCVGEFGSRQEHGRPEHLDAQAARSAPFADRARGDQEEGGAR